MKVTVYPGLSGARIGNVVPPAYRTLVPEALDPMQQYSVLLFAHAAREAHVVAQRKGRWTDESAHERQL